MASPSYPDSRIGTPFSPISNHTLILCLQLSSTPHFFTVGDQASGGISLPSFVSDAAVFPSPLLLKDCGFDLFHPLQEGLTDRWLNASCTQERLLDRAAAGALRLRPGANPPQKKFAR